MLYNKKVIRVVIILLLQANTWRTTLLNEADFRPSTVQTDQQAGGVVTSYVTSFTSLTTGSAIFTQRYRDLGLPAITGRGDWQ